MSARTPRHRTAKFDHESFVSECVTALGEDDAHRAIHELVRRSVSDPSGISDAVGECTISPMMRTWFCSDELTVLHIVWPPGVELFAHDHNMWASIGIYGGREDNQFFRRAVDGSIVPTRASTLHAGQAVRLGHDTVHAVANPTREWTAALHVYGGNFFTAERTAWRADTLQPVVLDPSAIVDTLEAAACAARPSL